jgi:hypothetical protein
MCATSICPTRPVARSASAIAPGLSGSGILGSSVQAISMRPVGTDKAPNFAVLGAELLEGHRDGDHGARRRSDSGSRDREFRHIRLLIASLQHFQVDSMIGLDAGLPILRWHQTDVMAQLRQHPRPKGRRGSGSMPIRHGVRASKNVKTWPRRSRFLTMTPLADSSRSCRSIGHPCLSGACFGCTDHAAGSSSLSASAAAAVACTLPGAW